MAHSMKDNTKIIFLGDSITDAGHNFQPVRDGECPLGVGYVSMIAEILGKKNCSIRNAGHDGFTVRDLLRMLDRDCLRRSPDLVSVLVGSNDVAVCMNTGMTLEETEFEQNYYMLLERIVKHTEATVVCMGPFLFPYPLEYRNWIPLLKEAEQIEQKAAQEMKLSFLPLHDRLNRIGEKEGYDRITVDGIHLTDGGARLVARAWVELVSGTVNKL